VHPKPTWHATWCHGGEHLPRSALPGADGGRRRSPPSLSALAAPSPATAVRGTACGGGASLPRPFPLSQQGRSCGGRAWRKCTAADAAGGRCRGGWRAMASTRSSCSASSAGSPYSTVGLGGEHGGGAPAAAGAGRGTRDAAMAGEMARR